MTDSRHVTAFEDHAKRASVGLPESLVEAAPFGVGDELDVRELDDGVAVTAADRRKNPGAIVRETDEGPRLYLDRMTVYDAGLLDGEVELRPDEESLRLTPAE